MRIRSDETYWLLKNGLLTVHPSLQKNVTCDVLVVGGGITGALMAYQCGLDGYRVILIDKRDIALGSTSATTSMLQYEIY
jgi:glycerol-3-phosphate dehydrogenase